MPAQRDDGVPNFRQGNRALAGIDRHQHGATGNKTGEMIGRPALNIEIGQHLRDCPARCADDAGDGRHQGNGRAKQCAGYCNRTNAGYRQNRSPQHGTDQSARQGRPADLSQAVAFQLRQLVALHLRNLLHDAHRFGRDPESDKLCDRGESQIAVSKDGRRKVLALFMLGIKRGPEIPREGVALLITGESRPQAGGLLDPADTG